MKKYSKAEERAMLKSKQLIKRYRFMTLVFTFLPYLLEDWLREMHKKGYILYRMKNRFLFFSFIFEKSNASVSYSVDVRNGVDASYFEHHEQCDWKLMYTPIIKNSGYSVWMHINTEQVAEFFSDVPSKVEPTKYAVTIYFWGVAAFWLLAIVMIAIARIGNFSEFFTEYCYTYFGICFFYTIPTPFVLSFYLHHLKKRGNTNVTQVSLSKVFLMINLATLAFCTLAFILSVVLTATTQVNADGIEEIILLAQSPFLYILQFTLFFGTLISFLGLFVTIPYRVIQGAKNRAKN